MNSQSGGRESKKFVSASIVAKGKAAVTSKAPATAKKKAARKLDSDDEVDDFADARRLAATEEPDVVPTMPSSLVVPLQLSPPSMSLMMTAKRRRRRNT